MMLKLVKTGITGLLCLALVGCGGFGNSGRSSGGVFRGGGNEQQGPVGTAQVTAASQAASGGAQERSQGIGDGSEKSLFSAFRSGDPNTNVRVNKYLWKASLETLSFLPVESADPFTGVLVMGWGRAPGSSRKYRATILIQDPALDARSLKVSVQTGGGPASAETSRRIEDAILTRARQLRVREKNL